MLASTQYVSLCQGEVVHPNNPRFTFFVVTKKVKQRKYITEGDLLRIKREISALVRVQAQGYYWTTITMSQEFFYRER